MLNSIKSIVKKLLPAKAASDKRDVESSERAALETVKLYVPPGHYYSPIPSIREIRSDESRIFGPISPW